MLTLLAVGPLAAAAVTQPGAGGAGSGTSTTNRSFTTNTNAANVNASNTNAANVNRGLDAAKLRACQNREAAVNRIQARMTRRLERHLEVFTDIAERVQAFYARKGYSVTDYAALVSAVNTERAAVRTQLETLELRAGFDCTGTDPRGSILAFQEQHRDTVETLQQLQTAVRNLVVGVKSAVGQERSDRNTNASNANATLNTNA